MQDRQISIPYLSRPLDRRRQHVEPRDRGLDLPTAIALPSSSQLDEGLAFYLCSGVQRFRATTSGINLIQTARFNFKRRVARID